MPGTGQAPLLIDVERDGRTIRSLVHPARNGYLWLLERSAAGIGFQLAIVLMSTIRERLDREWVPKPFRGVPIAFITAGLMALAFMAFDKALLKNLLG